MIKKTTKIVLKDKVGKNDIECIIEPKKELIVMKLGGVKSFIDMKDIYTLALMIVNSEQMDWLIPTQGTALIKYTRQHKVEVKKDLKKGEEVIVNCEVHIPSIIDENIRASLKQE